MNEKLLQYLWNYKVFSRFDFEDTHRNSIEILDFGDWNQNSGPDFLFGKIKTKNLVLAGNIEIHVKSSDWIHHKHSNDPNYRNIILHVVYENDIDIKELSQNNIPVLELKQFINNEIFQKYSVLLSQENFIPCESFFDSTKIPLGFHEKNIFRKLDLKSLDIQARLKHSKNNYEAVFFQLLSYSFGLKINAPIFLQIAEHLDFSVIQKIKNNQNQLEVLLMGKGGLLENPKDEQAKNWKAEYNFIKKKYKIADISFLPKFLRLRPSNFPTIRLSQLAHLYSRETSLFSKCIEAKNINDIYKIFDSITASEYWDVRFNFGKNPGRFRKKNLTKDFVDIIILNTIIPIKYDYYKNFNEDITDEILNLYENIKPENNITIQKWKNINMNIKSALESQSLLFWHESSCKIKNCLNCDIGLQLLKS